MQNKTNIIEIYRWWVVNAILILMGILIYKFVNRHTLIDIINQGLPPAEAGLLRGMLLGDKSGFERGFYDSLKNSGLVHLVVASGSNVILVVGGLIENLAAWFGRKRAIVGGVVAGWWYVNLVGWEIPVVRAMLLVSIMYWSQFLGRKFDLWRGIVLGVLVMVFGEPMVLMSVSFWLSITAFVAVVTARRFEKQKMGFLRFFYEILWVTVWITPIVGLVFGRNSLISPLTNVLVIGLVGLVTVTGIVGIVLGGGIFLWLTYPGLKYLVEVVRLGGMFPVLEFRFNWWMLIGWYMTLFYFINKNKIKNY